MALSWSERQAVAEVVGSLTSAAALCDFRPGQAAEVRAEILVALDAGSQLLVRELAAAVEADRYVSDAR